jgi:transcriptional regulator of NAD metabolism
MRILNEIMHNHYITIPSVLNKGEQMDINELEKHLEKYNIVSIYIDRIEEEFIHNEDEEGLKKFQELSSNDLIDMIWKVDGMHDEMIAELRQSFMYELCKKIKENKK